MSNSQLAQKSKLNEMLDHAPRIRAQQQREAELAAIKELETRVAPLIWLVYVAAFLAVLCIGLDGWKRYQEMAAYYTELAAEHEALVQCIKGHSFRLDDAVLRCEVSKYKLVAGLKS